MNSYSWLTLPSIYCLRTALILSTIAALLAGCASAPPAPEPAPVPQTNVDYHAVVAPDMKRYALVPGMSSTTPVPVDRTAPIYPAAMIPLHLPVVTVHAKVVVDETGKAAEIQITHVPAGAPYPSAFDDAVAKSMLDWRYTPLRFSRWQDEYDAQGNSVGSHQVVVAAKPFSLDYAFNFLLRDGKPVVGAQAIQRND